MNYQKLISKFSYMYTDTVDNDFYDDIITEQQTTTTDEQNNKTTTRKDDSPKDPSSSNNEIVSEPKDNNAETTASAADDNKDKDKRFVESVQVEIPIPDILPEDVRWFYKAVQDKLWLEFSGYDSLRIEEKYRNIYKERYSSSNPEDSDDNTTNDTPTKCNNKDNTDNILVDISISSRSTNNDVILISSNNNRRTTLTSPVDNDTVKKSSSENDLSLLLTSKNIVSPILTDDSDGCGDGVHFVVDGNTTAVKVAKDDRLLRSEVNNISTNLVTDSESKNVVFIANNEIGQDCCLINADIEVEEKLIDVEDFDGDQTEEEEEKPDGCHDGEDGGVEHLYDPERRIVVRGGMYEVDLNYMTCESIYWPGEQCLITRGVYFYDATWQPLEMEVSLEMELQHKRLFCDTRKKPSSTNTSTNTSATPSTGNSNNSNCSSSDVMSTTVASSQHTTTTTMTSSNAGVTSQTTTATASSSQQQQATQDGSSGGGGGKSSPIVLYTAHFTDFHVAWLSPDEIYLYSENAPSKIVRSVTHRLGFQKSTGYRLRRGYRAPASPLDEPQRVSHLVFVIHGIGQKMDAGKIIRNTAAFRECVDWLKSKYFPSANQRAEFFPVEWRSSLKLDSDMVDAITPHNVLSIRHLLNCSAMDIMYYTSPLYGMEVQRGLIEELNRLHAMFLLRNPTFRGPVSVLAHSLGSVILYDVITGYRPGQSATSASGGSCCCSCGHGSNSNSKDESATSPMHSTRNPSSKINTTSRSPTQTTASQQQLSPSTSHSIENLSRSDRNNSCTSGSNTSSGNNSTTTSPTKSNLKMSARKARGTRHSPSTVVGSNKTTSPLQFEIEQLFCLGSPLSVFIALRLSDPNRQDVLPRGLCTGGFYNIFHLSDPVAYRMEPLLCKDYRNVAPLMIQPYSLAVATAGGIRYDEMPLEVITTTTQQQQQQQQQSQNTNSATTTAASSSTGGSGGAASGGGSWRIWSYVRPPWNSSSNTAAANTTTTTTNSSNNNNNTVTTKSPENRTTTTSPTHTNVSSTITTANVTNAQQQQQQMAANNLTDDVSLTASGTNTAPSNNTMKSTTGCGDATTNLVANLTDHEKISADSSATAISTVVTSNGGIADSNRQVDKINIRIKSNTEPINCTAAIDGVTIMSTGIKDASKDSGAIGYSVAGDRVIGVMAAAAACGDVNDGKMAAARDGSGSTRTIPDGGPETLARLANRLDYAIRETGLAKNYWSAITSHTSYWSNYDVAYFVLSRLFPELEREKATAATVGSNSGGGGVATSGAAATTAAIAITDTVFDNLPV